MARYVTRHEISKCRPTTKLRRLSVTIKYNDNSSRDLGTGYTAMRSVTVAATGEKKTNERRRGEYVRLFWNIYIMFCSRTHT